MASFLQKYRLFQGLCNGERAYTGPFYVTLDLTRRCNLSCLGCRFHSKESKESALKDQDIMDFPFDWAERLFSEFRSLNTRMLFLMGDGEPFLYPRIFDVVHMAKKFGLHVTITTNGTLLDQVMAEHIVNSGLDAMHVSLWASSYEEYLKQYPGVDPVNFERVVNGMRILSSLKAKNQTKVPHIMLSNPVNRLNFQSLDKMIELAREAGADAIAFTPFKSNRGKLSHYGLTRCSQEDLCNRAPQLKRKIRQYSLGDNINRFILRYRFNDISDKLPCYIYWFHSRIKVDGTVLSCGRSELILGDLKKESFSDIWNGQAYRTLRNETLSSSGFKHRNEICDCEFCSFVQDNMSVHKIFKYLLPFRGCYAWLLRKKAT